MWIHIAVAKQLLTILHAEGEGGGQRREEREKEREKKEGKNENFSTGSLEVNKYMTEVYELVKACLIIWP
jgi:hypothetical protein